MANEDLLVRQMPHSLEGEQAVLGSMLIDAECIKDVMEKLQPGDFYLRQNREIFETIYSMQYVQIVRDKALLRSLLDDSDEISETVRQEVGSASDILEAAEKKIFALRKDRGSESLEHIGTILLKVYDRLNELAQSGRDIPGLSTGLHDLDKKINGLNKTDLILIAARPGMAATNRKDILDPALLRPGRFDRQIYVGTPDARGREAILRVHSKDKPLADNVDLGVIARATAGFTGADLANLLNEAALLAARSSRRVVTMRP